jgi:electron transport complex protein RnfA
MIDLIFIIINAALINNLVLSSFLGLTPLFATSRTVGGAARMGGAMIFTVTLASALCAAIYCYVLLPLGAVYLQTFVYIMAIAAIVGLAAALIKRFLPAWYEGFGAHLLLLAVNSSVLGAVLLNGQLMVGLRTTLGIYESDLSRTMDFWPANHYVLTSTVNGLGSALGFALVIVIIAGIREKIADNDIPAAFRGLPITLVAAGLVALAFCALAL